MRGAGRTTAMLMQAAEAKREGYKILVIVHEQRMIPWCIARAQRAGITGLNRHTDFCTPYTAVQSQRFRGLKYRNVFIDHAVYELTQSYYIYEMERDLELLKRAEEREFVRRDPLHGATNRFEIFHERFEGILFEVADPWCDCEEVHV